MYVVSHHCCSIESCLSASCASKAYNNRNFESSTSIQIKMSDTDSEAPSFTSTEPSGITVSTPHKNTETREYGHDSVQQRPCLLSCLYHMLCCPCSAYRCCCIILATDYCCGCESRGAAICPDCCIKEMHKQRVRWEADAYRTML